MNPAAHSSGCHQPGYPDFGRGPVDFVDDEPIGRVVDWARQIGDALRNLPQEERKRLGSQLEILVRRGRLLRLAISFATLSALVAAILIMALYLTAFLHVEVVLLSALLFIACQ